MAAQPPAETEQAALSLAMAVVAASPGPVLLLDGDLTIMAASDSFGAAFAIDPATVVGRTLAEAGQGEWNTPQLRALFDTVLSEAAEIEACEMELRRKGQKARTLIIHAQRLAYLDLENVRLMVAVSDVTEARANALEKEEALRQNLVLLQEVRHRVANSLQIIASVLLQNAKRTASDETRGHLKDAHSRVMSVAELERQLSSAGDGQVDIAAYFTTLCANIGASMIGDDDLIALVTSGSGGTVPGRVSVSLGLIVTELVINALKYAFPGGRRGTITVDFQLRGPNWTLAVTDDGVGMAADPGQGHIGLGTSIVRALARQLQADVAIGPGHPGTRVTVTHTQIALVEDHDVTLESPAEQTALRPSEA